MVGMFFATSLAMLGNYYIYDSIGPVAELLSRQLGWSDTQIGTLNAIYSLPNIVMVLIGGVLVDRYSARSVTLFTSVLCLLGAIVTALGSEFPVMVAGRLLFGLGAETMVVAVTVAFAQWFVGRYFALMLALNITAVRFGSYLADRSPTFASDLYAQGWQSPLWLAAAFGVLSVVGALAYWIIDRHEAARGTLAIAPPSDRIDWSNLLRFRVEYWLIVGICVTFYAVIFPFRSTFSIKYFQEAHGLTLEAASTLNSHVFLAAMFLTPVFGLLLDRVQRHGLLLTVGALGLPVSFLLLASNGTENLTAATVLLGASYSLVPAVLWPAVARYCSAEQLGTAYGLMTALQQAGVFVANIVAGYVNDRGGASVANPAGYDAMLWFFGLLSLAAFVFAILLSRQRSKTAAGGLARAEI
ncbi:MFS transporter [Povalibacter sp.]|uniref:MFS transporter n=1 Tax=Povalibacter sp. TaxID=1962978 RepID=UPI002F41E980